MARNFVVFGPSWNKPKFCQAYSHTLRLMALNDDGRCKSWIRLCWKFERYVDTQSVLDPLGVSSWREIGAHKLEVRG
jgi:hypothetical protein